LSIKALPSWKKAIIVVPAVLIVSYSSLSVTGVVIALRIPRLPLENSLVSINAEYEDINFSSRGDSVNLKGWLLEPRYDRVIVIIHGGFQNRIDKEIDTIDLARDIVRKGYSLLLFDLRGRGESGGEGRALSFIEEDIGGAVDYLERRGYERHKIGLIGFCSGAVASLVFSTRENVGAVVLDGCFSTVEGMIVNQAAIRNIPAILVRLFLPGMKVAAKTIYGFQPVEPIDIVPQVKCPVLFIHEEYDDIVSWGETVRLFEANRNPASEIWQVPGAKHSKAYLVDPGEFVDRIDDFFTRHLVETVPR
jgi:pimeloyl-ACP methyl ester carboxylesterase